MLVVSFGSWWYGAGWRHAASQALHKLARLSEFFSLGLLLRTLFSPYRQISAGAVRGPLNLRMRAFFDRLFSRFIGFFLRIIMVCIGCIAILATAIFSAIWLIAWPLIPLSPLLFITFAVMGLGV